jgi:sensor domain CHASE-containing protein
MNSDVEELLNDIRKVRNDLVAQANPHFQSLTNIIYKWETKIATKDIDKMVLSKQQIINETVPYNDIEEANKK